MDASTWAMKMESLMSEAFLANRCDVIDIHFDGGHTREVYLASDMAMRRRGLSHVSSIGTDGMLFTYPVPSFVPFTMKDMSIDLDVAWYTSKGDLIQMRSLKAGSETPECSPVPFSYVLEAPVDTIPKSNLRVRF